LLNETSSTKRVEPAEQIAWFGFIALLVGAAYYRSVAPLFPSDLSAYLAGVETFLAGGNPYTNDILEARSWRGYNFVYPPVALYLMSWMAWFDPETISIVAIVVRLLTLALGFYLIRPLVGLEDQPIPVLVIASMLFYPVMVDLWWANIHIPLCTAICAVLVASTRRPSPFQLVFVALAGLLLFFKPTWFVAGAVVVALSKRKAIWAVFAAAGLFSLALSLARLDLFYAWIDRLQWLSVMSRGGAPFEWPPLWITFVIAWSGGFIQLIRKRGFAIEIWPYALTIFLVFPRQGAGTLLVVFPAFLWLISRIPRSHAIALALLTAGPLPWVLRSEAKNLITLPNNLFTIVIAIYAFYLLADSGSEEKSEQTGAI
jgi:hypothetical protein